MAKNEEDNKILDNVPDDLRNGLIKEYKKVVARYESKDFEYHETAVGKFCEIVLRIFEYKLEGDFTPIDEKNPQSDKIINKVENGNSLDSNLRNKVAPMVRILLNFRNDRDAAHVGGIDLQQIDSNFTFYATRWIYAELIRLDSGLGTDQIQEIIDDIGKIEFPGVFSIGNEDVISFTHLNSEQEILLSLVGKERTRDELFKMNREVNKSRFFQRLLVMAKRKLIFKTQKETYVLLPLGKEASSKLPIRP